MKRTGEILYENIQLGNLRHRSHRQSACSGYSSCCAESGHAILSEAMTIYHMPLYKKLHEIAVSGELGPLRMIQMNFGSYKEYDMANRFFNRNLAGGAMLDIGVYALSFVRWFMSSAPDQILSQVKLAPTGVDEQATILLSNQEQEMKLVLPPMLFSMKC
jgi:predicted dehydrogenase